MQSKLTLRLDADLIRFGKQWAQHQGTSLSGLVAEYLKTLEQLTPAPDQLAPQTRQLLGLLQDADLSDYHGYLEDKYR
ncbi:MAG: antitoxin [Candidatus Sericytochromatia bacterium]|nr:antitoxin [Candidatus Sericytochromatia bacterium]